MSNKELPDISVGDFAMSLLSDMAKNPDSLKPALKESTTQSANVPDISKIKVPDDYVTLITEGRKPEVKPKPQVQPVKESAQDRMQDLVERLSTLLSEARKLIEELSPGATTVGNIGVNMAGSKKSKKKKKNGILTYKVPNTVVHEAKKPNPWAVCHSSTGPSKSDKFERCVHKIKSKYGIKK